MAKEYRRKGEGNFSVTPSGGLAYRFRYTDEYGRRRSKSVSGINEKHCYERAEQFLHELERKINFVNYEATIPQLVREKIENDYKKNYFSEQTYHKNINIINIVEKNSIGYIPICSITPYHIECFYNEITKYSNGVIRQIYRFLKNAFEIAYQKKIIDKNIMNENFLRCPKSDQQKRRVRGMTEDEQRTFVEALKNYRVQNGCNSYKLQLMIELYSGMRMGEINALKLEDINFKQGYVRVNRTVSRGANGRRFISEKPKTIAGERDVPISKPLAELLKQAIAEMKENPEGLIFYNHIGNSIISTNQVNGQYKAVCKKAKIQCGGQHALRHTFATRCIEAGVPALVLKNWLGHTDIHITLDTYADVFDRMNLGAISKFENLMDEFCKE